MTDFESTLRASLAGSNNRRSQAEIDLHQEVAMASDAVGRITNGSARLLLSRQEELPGAVRFVLVLSWLDPTPERAWPTFPGLRLGQLPLATLTVPLSGYPIRTGQDDAGPHHNGLLATRAEIASFLKEMAGEPSSPLVGYLAFYREPVAESVECGSGSKQGNLF